MQTNIKGLARTLHLRATDIEKMEGIGHFVEQEATEHRVLLSDDYKPLLEREVPAVATGARLDEALLRIRRKLEDQVKKAGQEIVALVDIDGPWNCNRSLFGLPFLDPARKRSECQRSAAGSSDHH